MFRGTTDWEAGMTERARGYRLRSLEVRRGDARRAATPLAGPQPGFAKFDWASARILYRNWPRKSTRRRFNRFYK